MCVCVERCVRVPTRVYMCEGGAGRVRTVSELHTVETLYTYLNIAWLSFNGHTTKGPILRSEVGE